MKLSPSHAKAATALATLLLAGSAAAQGSVTLFGVADVGVRRANTEDKGGITSIVSGSFSSSRFGFRGVEDLGGGLSASFWLESFLSADSGAVSPAGFQRRSTVSLAQRHIGELRLGRDYTPTHSNWSRFDPFGYVGVGAVQLLALSATGNTPVTAAFGTSPNPIQRVSNSVQYLLPRNAWGVEGGLSYSLPEGDTGATDHYRVAGGRLGKSFGKFFVQGAYLRSHSSTTTGAFEDMDLSASYDAGFVRVSGGVRHYDYMDSSQNNYLLAAVVPLGVHELKASWNRAAMDGRVGATSIEGNRADQIAIGYVYHLSKRTRLYSTLAFLENEGNSRFVLPGAPKSTANEQGSRAFEAGINTTF